MCARTQRIFCLILAVLYVFCSPFLHAFSQKEGSLVLRFRTEVYKAKTKEFSPSDGSKSGNASPFLMFLFPYYI